MAGVVPDHVLVHVATPLTYVEDSASTEWIEGEPGAAGGGEPTSGVPFPCVLFLPSAGGAEPNAYRGRVVRQPQLLYNPTRADGSPVVIGDEDELLIFAPELAAWTGGETVRWQAVGDAQPFGPPGQVVGILAIVRQVKD